MTGSLRWLDAVQVESSLSYGDAVDALERALEAGLDPAADCPRTVVEVDHGHLLLMPSQSASSVGVKVASVAPANPGHGLPRIQAVYLLWDAETLSPVAMLDGTAITSRRTPAVSAVAARHLATPCASRLVVFGTGPQARGHIAALRAVRDITEVVVIGRNAARTEAFAEEVAQSGITAVAGDPGAVAEADIVICATTSTEPLFAGALVPDRCCVIAVGSHEPHVRELDAALLRRATVVVEDAATALREAGDVILAVSEGALKQGQLVPLTDVVRGRVTVDSDLPRVFKSVGMGWQDVVVAAAVYARSSDRRQPAEHESGP